MEKRKASQPQKPHATSQPSRFSHTPTLSTDAAHNKVSRTQLRHAALQGCRVLSYSRMISVLRRAGTGTARWAEYSRKYDTYQRRFVYIAVTEPVVAYFVAESNSKYYGHLDPRTALHVSPRPLILNPFLRSYSVLCPHPPCSCSWILSPW